MRTVVRLLVCFARQPGRSETHNRAAQLPAGLPLRLTTQPLRSRTQRLVLVVDVEARRSEHVTRACSPYDADAAGLLLSAIRVKDIDGLGLAYFLF